VKIADVVSDDRIAERRRELEHHVVARIAEERPPEIEDLPLWTMLAIGVLLAIAAWRSR